jgi:hypothetical protein
MRALLRKLRGLLGVGVTWGVLWGLVGAAIGVVATIIDPASVDSGEGPLVVGAIIGFQGLVAGVGFGVLLAFAETRKTILALSGTRAAMWGVLASAALPLVTGMPVGMLWLVCPLGAASAAAAVAMARRAELGDPKPPELLETGIGEPP